MPETEESSDAADVELTVNGNLPKELPDGQAKMVPGWELTGRSKNAAYISNRRVTVPELNRILMADHAERRYKASFWVKYTEGPETKEFILTARKNRKETTYQNLVKGVAKINEWTEITGTFVISDEVSSIYLFFETQWKEEPDPAEDLMDFYIRDVSIKEYPVTKNEINEALPNGSVLGTAWQWNHNPDNTKWSLTARKGYLRLETAGVAENILNARNTLTQRTQGPYCSGWILMDTSNMTDGDYAGLAAFQQEYGIGVTKKVMMPI